jgi:uncharacterized damage-inducible protein DinB
MSIGTSFLPEFDQEMMVTRRLLDRVPAAHIEWKPHPKSFALGHLAQLISGMPSWITNALTEDSLDLAAGKGYSFEAPSALLAAFDENVRGARAALASAKDAVFGQSWSLRMGDKVLLTETRGVVVRQDINHLVHHRGQLSVYLRLLDVSIPSIYGPTADDRSF